MHGKWKLISQEEISPGTLISELLGEVMPLQTFLKTRFRPSKKHLPVSALLVNSCTVISCSQFGNIASCCNHSHEPNARLAVLFSHGEMKVVVIAIQGISFGEEITISYSDYVLCPDYQRLKCECNSRSCTGQIPYVSIEMQDSVCLSVFLWTKLCRTTWYHMSVLSDLLQNPKDCLVSKLQISLP